VEALRVRADASPFGVADGGVLVATITPAICAKGTKAAGVYEAKYSWSRGSNRSVSSSDCNHKPFNSTPSSL
jgi:hypothetical protein